MTNKIILIDSAHREETRVALLENGILQDFDRESISVKQIKGNIYLAKIIRVEASLQAAFVDYGCERHGFLPLSDIHPDYFQIDESEKKKISEDTKIAQNNNDDEQNFQSEKNDDRGEYNDSSITTGAYSVEDEAESFRGNIYNVHKKYNIQDVIKQGQLILVQATKEERGNKGASMTTYISLAGKYCVLMSNTPNKGGVSRKVENFRDRKVLKAILSEMNVPQDCSVILRTAGVGKKPDEIKRDYEYLNRLWESIKEAAKSSSAKTFIHAEDDVIKRCIRDVYNEEVSEVVVEGKSAFETVSSFVKLIMPSANHNVKFYNERVPLFNKYRVEQQISALYEKNISLPSGGSIVIDITEALVSIDVNSGRSTKERAIEDTAFNTNMEAAKEIAKQLRLRDLAGLIVIDFIDMYDQRNRRNVERTLRDELQNDRARIQIGRISVFGLLEMSRQRLGASLFETITEPCKHCSGTGYTRSVEVIAINILRAVRYSCADKQAGVIYVYTTPEVISYMMNYKKNEIIDAEKSYHVHIFMHTSDEVGSSGFNIRKRKSLSEEERREIEMEVVTGKVNQLGLERGSFDASASSNDSPRIDRRSDNRDYEHKGNNRSRFNKNNRRRKFNNKKPEKSGFIKSMISMIKRSIA
jgi:ribonuclease E